MFALLRHHIRRSWLAGTAAATVLFVFMVLLCRVFQQMNADGPNPLARFMPKWAQTAFNINPEAMSVFNGFLAVGFQHPVVLLVLLGLPIALATGYITGDIERRNLGLVLSRPIGRIPVVVSTFLVCLLWVALGLLALIAGCYAGHHWANIQQPIDAVRLWRAAAALFALVAAFSAADLLFSTMFEERSDAIGWCVTLILVLYVWNFLSQMLGSSGTVIPNYSLFAFYKPTGIMMRGEWFPHHLQILAAVAATSFLAACGIFRLRNLNL